MHDGRTSGCIVFVSVVVEAEQRRCPPVSVASGCRIPKLKAASVAGRQESSATSRRSGKPLDRLLEADGVGSSGEGIPVVGPVSELVREKGQGEGKAFQGACG